MNPNKQGPISEEELREWAMNLATCVADEDAWTELFASYVESCIKREDDPYMKVSRYVYRVLLDAIQQAREVERQKIKQRKWS